MLGINQLILTLDPQNVNQVETDSLLLKTQSRSEDMIDWRSYKPGFQFSWPHGKSNNQFGKKFGGYN